MIREARSGTGMEIVWSTSSQALGRPAERGGGGDGGDVGGGGGEGVRQGRPELDAEAVREVRVVAAPHLRRDGAG